MKSEHKHLSRTCTLILLALLLFASFGAALKRTSQSQFDLPEEQKIHVILPTRAPTPLPSPTPDPLSLFREARSNRFTEISDILSTLAEDTSVSEEMRTQLHERGLAHARNEHFTLLIETALQGLGYPDAVCAVQNQSVSVFLSAPIHEKDGQMLRDLVREWTGFPSSCVRLIQSP